MQRISEEIKRIESGQPVSKSSINPLFQTPSNSNLVSEVSTFEGRRPTVAEKLQADRLAYLAQILTLKKVNPNDPQITVLEEIVRGIDLQIEEEALRIGEQKELEELERQAGLREPSSQKSLSNTPDVSPLLPKTDQNVVRVDLKSFSGPEYSDFERKDKKGIL